MAAMRYKGSVFITIIFFFTIVLLTLPLAYSSSTKSFYWLGETEDMEAAMRKENDGGSSSSIEVEERKVPTGSDPLHHNHFPFTSP